MRWLFLLLLLLNVFYLGWHQQQAPMVVKEIAPLAANGAHRQEIRLLSESGKGGGQCMFVGGFAHADTLQALRQRLLSLDIQSEARPLAADGYWLRIDAQSRRLVDEALLSKLALDFAQIKNRIMSCEGIATTG